jgi:hypothetical protein
MQKERTIQFWDDLYNQEETTNSKKEWIVHPNTALLHCLAQRLPTNATRILEIGSGTSTLARDLYLYLRTCDNRSTSDVCMLATDVSSVGIAFVQNRDDNVLLESCGAFQYQVLNLTSALPTEFLQQFDMFVYKVCLDTFLYRSKRRGASANLATSVLDKIHSMLQPETGVYVVVTPRKRFRALQENAGFACVEQHALDFATMEVAEIADGKYESRGYVYTCRVKSERKIPGQTLLVMDDLPKSCAHCNLLFPDFCRQLQSSGRGSRTDQAVARQWLGHCRHCKHTFK